MALGGADGKERVSQVSGRDGARQLEAGGGGWRWGALWWWSGVGGTLLKNDEDELTENCLLTLSIAV